MDLSNTSHLNVACPQAIIEKKGANGTLLLSGIDLKSVPNEAMK
jgi:hypothetical protein